MTFWELFKKKSYTHLRKFLTTVTQEKKLISKRCLSETPRRHCEDQSVFVGYISESYLGLLETSIMELL